MEREKMKIKYMVLDLNWGCQYKFLVLKIG